MDGEVVIGIDMDTKGFDIQIATVEEELEGLIEEYKELKETKPFEGQQKGLQELQKKIEQTRNKLVDLKKKQDNLDNSQLSQIPTSLSGIGNGIESVIKKVTRWGLALFGIRSMYNFIRSSMSTLSGYNDQLATDVEYIKFALATTLQPVIERIIQLAYTLLQYINYIAKAWFGVNLFANASAKAFRKGNKQAQEMKKTLAGFDEMNVLSDNSNADSGGAVSPTIDLSEFEDFDTSIVGNWLDKLKDFILKGFDVIANNIKKIMKDLGFSQDMIDAFSFWIDGVRKMLEGFLDFIIGILKIIVGMFTGNTELLKEGIKQAINGLTTFLKGVLQYWIGLITMIAATITTTFKSLWNGVANGAKDAVNNIKNFFNSIPSFFSSIVNRITDFFRNLGYSAGNVIGGAFKSVVNAVLRTIENILNTPIRTINSMISTINRLPGVNIGRLPTFYLPRLAKGGIVNMPGRGINYGGANIGEKAPEAVIPFTDEQVMDRLGQSIARHMVINATITNTMNGRVISREIQRVQNNSNFAMNR